ncbi:hypothetical protein AX17_000266 [Amanita inopinata Kibby_2008]|nr:hypothetical protein AX17_000266 [Amanita inopinata Kibby_2008]
MSDHKSSPQLPTHVEGARHSHNLDIDVSVMSLLMSQYNVDASGDDADISELLEQLENADGIANGIENRLDDVLGSLDDLLELLESGTEDTRLKTSAKALPTASSHEAQGTVQEGGTVEA